MKNILLLCGGDGAEHQISLISAKFIESKLNEIEEYNVITVEIHDKKFITANGSVGFFNKDSEFVVDDNNYFIDCVVPCIHGVPGETGDIQSFLEILNIPYIGCKSEASHNCFNKITTKLYLSALNIPNTPFLIIPRKDEIFKQKALEAFDVWQDVYVKAASQGSSIGCYHVTKKEDLWDSIVEAFMYSDDVIVEKTIKHRELECAAYEMDGNIFITNPGEIIMPDNLFYTFDEKYSKDSGSTTTVEPQNLSEEIKEQIRNYARAAFVGLKLRDLSRIDFFLSDSDEIIINEINTFPGMTPISMFPKLLEHNGHQITDFFKKAIERAIAEQKQL